MSDPRLHTPEWAALVAYWRAELERRPLACARCGGPIQRGGRRGPWHLDVGHKDNRADDPRRVWRIEDTQPEHARCNRSAGAAFGNARRRHSPRRPIQSEDW